MLSSVSKSLEVQTEIIKVENKSSDFPEILRNWGESFSDYSTRVLFGLNERKMTSFEELKIFLNHYGIEIEVYDRGKLNAVKEAIQESLNTSVKSEKLFSLIPGSLHHLPLQCIKKDGKTVKGLKEFHEELQLNESEILLLRSKAGEELAVRAVCTASLRLTFGGIEIYEDKYFCSPEQLFSIEQLKNYEEKLNNKKITFEQFADILNIKDENDPETLIRTELRCAKRPGISEKYPFGADPITGDKAAFTEEFGFSSQLAERLINEFRSNQIVKISAAASGTYFDDNDAPLTCVYKISSAEYPLSKEIFNLFPRYEIKKISDTLVRICLFCARPSR